MLLVDRIYTLGLWIRKVVDHFKQGLIGHPSSIMEDSGTESNIDYGHPTQEDSEEKNISKCPTGHSCAIW